MAKPKRKPKSNKWFKPVRGSYLPCSRAGWLTYIPFVGYLTGVLVFVIRNNYSLWQSVFWLVPNYIAATAVMTWLASHKSK